MTRDEALGFLRARQPMGATKELDEAEIRRYDEVRRYFLASPDSDCIAPFLNSFGDGDGFGVYQLVDDVMRQFPRSQVVPHLVRGLRSTHRSVRYWNAQIAASFPDNELIAPLTELLATNDHDVEYAAITSLEAIESRQVVMVLRAALAAEDDTDIAEFMRDVLAERGD
jgi:hypothetical protein